MKTLVVTYPLLDTLPARMAGKLLQIRLCERDCLLLAGSDAYRYHNQALANLLLEQGIAHRWEGDATLVWDDSSVKAIGGGRFVLDIPAQTIRVWDRSGIYGPFDPERLAAALAAAGPPWDGLQLVLKAPPVGG